MKRTETHDAHGNPYPNPRLRERLHFFPEVGLTIYDSHITVGAIKSRFLKDFGCEGYDHTLPSEYIALLMDRVWCGNVHVDLQVYDRTYVPIRMKAKCDDEDKFTERAGIDITRAKFNDRLNKAYVSVMKEYRKDLAQMYALALSVVCEHPWKKSVTKDKNLVFELATTKDGNDMIRVKSKAKPKLRIFFIEKYIRPHMSLNELNEQFLELVLSIAARSSNKMWVGNLDNDLLRFSGKSICHKDDAFSPKVGKEFALQSAYEKYDHAMIKLFTGFMAAVSKELIKVDKILDAAKKSPVRN